MLFVSTRQDMDVERGRRASAASTFRVVPFLLSRYISCGTNIWEGQLENNIIDFQGQTDSTGGPVQCRERLGGMLNYYYRRAG
jgi:hypothetical protein